MELPPPNPKTKNTRITSGIFIVSGKENNPIHKRIHGNSNYFCGI